MCWWQAFIVLSCLISVSVNFSTFMVIGKTSPVTYQVLGHLKTCLVLGFGYFLLRDPFSWQNILGIIIAMLGMILYSYYCTSESQQKSIEAASLLSQVLHLVFLVFHIVLDKRGTPFCHKPTCAILICKMIGDDLYTQYYLPSFHLITLALDFCNISSEIF